MLAKRTEHTEERAPAFRDLVCAFEPAVQWILRIEREGRAAALAGAPYSANPYHQVREGSAYCRWASGYLGAVK